MDELGLDPGGILAAFEPYRPLGLTAAFARANLARKIADPGFRHDLDPLVTDGPDGYSIDGAAELVETQLLDRLDD